MNLDWVLIVFLLGLLISAAIFFGIVVVKYIRDIEKKDDEREEVP